MTVPTESEWLVCRCALKACSSSSEHCFPFRTGRPKNTISSYDDYLCGVFLMVVVVAVEVTFRSQARIMGEGSTNHCLPALYKNKIGDQLACTIPTVYTRISPQWLSGPSRLWRCVPWRVACELVFLIGFHTMPGKHSEFTPNSEDEVGVLIEKKKKKNHNTHTRARARTHTHNHAYISSCCQKKKEDFFIHKATQGLNGHRLTQARLSNRPSPSSDRQLSSAI